MGPGASRRVHGLEDIDQGECRLICHHTEEGVSPPLYPYPTFLPLLPLPIMFATPKARYQDQ